MSRPLIFSLGLIASSAVAAPPEASEIELMTGTAEAEDEEKKVRTVSRRPKTRDGSWLQKNEPMPEVVETRGAYQSVLDAELATHYRRLAVLDRIIEVATASNVDGLAGRADAVRRKEVGRFRTAMTEFRNQAHARRIVGFP